MRTSKCPVTPFAAVVGGLLAGVIGTIGPDAVQYLKYRRGGGTESPLAWEFAPIDSWGKAPAPGQVTKRLIEGFTRREISRSGTTTRRPWPETLAGDLEGHLAYGAVTGTTFRLLSKIL